MGAYRYGRPHVGFQALMANALLTDDGALGYVTELLSGEFNAAFGRSSHHQVWSEAMVVTPVLRGSARDRNRRGRRRVAVCAELPANWDSLSAHNITAGNSRFDFTFTRSPGRLTVAIERRDAPNQTRPAQSPTRIIRPPASPSTPWSARSAWTGGRTAKFQTRLEGDIQQAEVVIAGAGAKTSVSFSYEGGSDVYQAIEAPLSGDRNHGLRVLRSRAGRDDLQLTLEGHAGRAYPLRIRTPRRAGAVSGGELRSGSGDAELLVRFEGTGNNYVRKEVKIALGSLLR